MSIRLPSVVLDHGFAGELRGRFRLLESRPPDVRSSADTGSFAESMIVSDSPARQIGRWSSVVSIGTRRPGGLQSCHERHSPKVRASVGVT